MGITDVRLTGGEPLVRRELPELVAMLSRIEGLEDLSLTTNGYLLERDGGRPRRRRAYGASTSRSTRSRGTASSRSRGATRFRRSSPASRRSSAIRSSARSRSTASRCAASRRTRSCRSPRLARRKPYQVRFIEFMPLDADHAWSEDRVLTGREIREMIDSVYPLEPVSARVARDRQALPLPRREGRDRLHQSGLRAVLRRLQPDPPDRRGKAPHLPLQPSRDRPARAPSLRMRRRGDRGDHPRGRLAQGAQAPRVGARVPPAPRSMSRIGG